MFVLSLSKSKLCDSIYKGGLSPSNCEEARRFNNFALLASL